MSGTLYPGSAYPGQNAVSSSGPISYTLSASAGTFALSGQPAQLQKTAYILAADAGSFIEAGQSISLHDSRSIVAAAGSFALTGADAALQKSYQSTAGAGSFTEIGQVALLHAGRLITAGQGSFIFTGQSATLTYTRGAVTYTLSAEVGLFFLTGADADLIKGPAQLPDSAFVYTWGSSSPRLRKAQASAESSKRRHSYVLTAGRGVFTLTGHQIVFSYTPIADERRATPLPLPPDAVFEAIRIAQEDDEWLLLLMDFGEL